jgi:hypothetical protein
MYDGGDDDEHGDNRGFVFDKNRPSGWLLCVEEGVPL